jgi:hypothetical protein
MARFSKYCMHQTRILTFFKQSCTSSVLFLAKGDNCHAAEQRHQLGQQKAALLRRSAFRCRLWRAFGVRLYGSAAQTSR